MIKLAQPSLALHSYNVPGYEFKMWLSWKMPKNATVPNVVSWIEMAVNKTKDSYLQNVVINCHGGPGRLRIGENCRMTASDVGLFIPIRGKVGTIWLVACEVAKGDGKYFCSQLAVSAGCDVIAGDKDQHVDIGFYFRFCPDNAIDDFEGNAFRFNKEGTYTTYSTE